MTEKRNLASLSDDFDFEEDEQTDITPKLKRNRKQPNRFGSTEDETNDDHLLDEIDREIEREIVREINRENDKENDKENYKETGTESNPNIVTDAGLSAQSLNNQSDTAILTAGEKILLKKLNEISTDVKVLQKTLVEMELKMEKVKTETHNLKSVDESLLLDIGLPLTTEERIIDFNNKLKNKPFWLGVVSINIFYFRFVISED